MNMNKVRYILCNIIGSGTFGTVYKCRNSNGELWCIKRIELSENPMTALVQYRQIMQEIYLLKNLNHPRIIKMCEYFIGKEGDHLCVSIVMEYANKGPLSTLILNQKSTGLLFDEKKIINIFVDMLLGLEFLHIKNVVHKDLKPDNVLICIDDRIKIADFGISKIADTVNIKNGSEPNDICGTPYYMAPEALIFKDFSFASDIWALGCLLYELCVLDSPFSNAKNIDDLILRTRYGIFKPLNTFENKYDDNLVAICSSMLQPNLNKRAKLHDIISDDVIVGRYYRSYFDFNINL